ncbi:efflux RND transporter periplasmic adaptor subunit [Roseisalinus antarcticus]|uniref:Multidrug resistance protein MdtA n=1 Tax=Roseisalinus antarcticus TaxID=254357 RepID=A0A1Y5SCV7_9RHOB|nr:efflux RND transporter periplasmic adaptor subunit [Roseisalinus antarcticus]SLN37827.1 Multidrug resistance protein MdtA precursor [Roseisalinus antarcticus]
MRPMTLFLGLLLPLTSPALADQPLAVAAVTAQETPSRNTLSLTGEIRAPESLGAAFPTGGRLAEITVEAGEEVARGTVLARIESVQEAQALRAAEAQLAAAEADFVNARDEDSRQSELFERGAITRSARDNAADRLAAATARKAQAEASLDQARAALDDTVLVAPQDAIVISRRAEPGQVIGAAQPVLELALGEGYEAVFDVPEGALTVSPSTPPTIRLSPIDRPGVSVTGQVSEISPLVDPAYGTVQVTVTLGSGVPGLTYGDAVRGTTSQTAGARVELPWSAIASTAAGPAVWVVDPETMTVSERPIDLWHHAEGRLILQSGVEEGEFVVTRGVQLLYPGRNIRIVEGDQ